MIFFLVPKLHNTLYLKLDCIADESDDTISSISSTLSHYLHEIKDQITPYINEWDTYKKYTNPYEYIHSSVPFKKKSIARYKPLSRAYFKMIELMELFNLNTMEYPIKSFHLAEGPGGFIEALSHMRNCKADQYYGMTLLDNTHDDMIPSWKKSDRFIHETKNVYIETGYDKTGNLLSMKNLMYCANKYGSSMHIITADGGFDFSLDFKNQEQNMCRLIFAQICFALCMQSYNGSFILKIFDCFTEATLDMIALLSSFYKKVYITKPNTSRCANSEKYIVCKGFLFSEITAYYSYILTAFEKMLKIPSTICIYRFLPYFSVPYFFLTKIEEYNSIFGQQQIENIHYTLSLIESTPKNEKIESIIKNNVQKCIRWCIKHKIQYNTIFKDIVID